MEPNDADTHYNLALALKYKGDLQAAVEAFLAAQRLRPNWVDAHFGLGATYYDLNNQVGALGELRSFVIKTRFSVAAHARISRSDVPSGKAS